MVNQNPQIGYMLKHTQALLHSRMDDVLRPLGLGVSQYVCLHLLHREPGISAAELARGAFVSRQAMNSLLQTLLDRGLVERPARPESGRALPAELTPEGEKLLARAEVVVEAVDQRMLSGLDKQERAVLGRSLAACMAALDEG